jgi:hypothetical protein
MSTERQTFSALSVGLKRNGSHESNYLLSHHHLHRHSDDMTLRDGVQSLLSLPRGNRRARNEVRSEVASITDSEEIDLAAARPTESTPDLGIGPSTSSTLSSSTSLSQASSSMSTA